MATSTSRLAYQDCYEILDKALANEKGIRFKIPDFGYGNHLRVRLHSARTIDRDDNKKTYQPDHRLYGRSIYDPIVVRLRQEQNQLWMYLERHNIEALDIQPLGDDYVYNQPTSGDLRQAGGEGGSQPREEAVEETIDIFDGEAEREADAPVEIAEASPAPVPVRRRI